MDNKSISNSKNNTTNNNINTNINSNKQTNYPRPQTLNYVKTSNCLNSNISNTNHVSSLNEHKIRSTSKNESFDSYHCTVDKQSELDRKYSDISKLDNNKPVNKRHLKHNNTRLETFNLDDYKSTTNNNSTGEENDENSSDNSSHSLLFPGYVPKALRYFTQDTKPRIWCLKMITSPWFERISIFVIIVNCITLGMYQPCVDAHRCTSTRCNILEYLDHFIHVFFTIEMSIKIMAMGFYGKDTYMAETWNRLDFFIVIAGTLEYLIATENLSLSAIRTVRVLRPLRAINRVPSMRILVMLLLDTLPMLGNVLLLCFFVFFIFGIVGVQLWKGVLRNRCYFEYNATLMSSFLDESMRNDYFKPDYSDSFICSEPGSSGMTTCADIPPFVNNSQVCNATIDILFTNNTSGTCVNWNLYYSNCRPSDKNPFRGAISFDNIGYAWVAIFQIISLESWVTIMYYIQDAHSFWNWIYFVFLIVLGSFFMINLCLVVIATQFSETKRRETERMIAERRRFSRSSSTLLSTSDSDPGSCWEELIKFIGHLIRRTHRRILKKYSQAKKNKLEDESENVLRLNKKHIKECNCNSNNVKLNNNTFICNNIINNHQNEKLKNVNLNQLKAQINQYHLSNHTNFKNFNLLTAQFNDSTNETNTKLLLSNSNTRKKKPNNNNNNNLSPNLTNKNQNLINFLVKSFKSSTSSLSNTESHAYRNSPSLFTSLSAPRASIDCYQLSESPSLNEISNQLHNNGSIGKASSLVLTPSPTIENNLNDKFSNVDKIIEECAICKGVAIAAVNSSRRISSNINAKVSCTDRNNNMCWMEHLCADNNTIQLTDETNLNTVLNRNNLKVPVSDTNISYSRIIVETKPDYCLKCFCFCCYDQLLNSRFFRFINEKREKLKILVDGKLQRAILCAILVNTLSMGIEHHDQPATLTQIVEYSNIIFTFLFLIEMLLKLFAYGGFDYIKSAYNMFDGVIVAVSMFEVASKLNSKDVVSSSPSGVSVLRTFRLLRILKLVRFMPALRRQLIVMLKTIDNVATFFSLLCLFIFIFSILGMNLFGCKFCSIGPDGIKTCERKNFDSLLWATITVFQVLTQEDWNEVLYNGMEKTSSWAALYFIALMTFGNYVLFNLLVAILVEGFSTEDEPKKSIEERIKEDAAIAVAEEREREHAHALTRKSSKKSVRRAASKQSLSASKHSRHSFKDKRKDLRSSNNNSLHQSKEESVKNDLFTHLSVQQPNKSSDTDLNSNNKLSIIQLPIITHTCATPVATPSSSFRNLILPQPNKRPISRLETISSKCDRKLSLDSTIDQMNFNELKSLLTRSTNRLFQNKNDDKRSGSHKILLNSKKICHVNASSKTTDVSVLNLTKDDLKGSQLLPLPKIITRERRSKSERIRNRKTSNIKLSKSFNENPKTLAHKTNSTNSIESKKENIKVEIIKPSNATKSSSFTEKSLSTSLATSNETSFNHVNDTIKKNSNDSDDEFIDFDCCSVPNMPKPTGCFSQRYDYSLYLFSRENKLRKVCIYITRQKWFDMTILLFIALNCITLAMERPSIPPLSLERRILTNSNYAFTLIFAIEMILKVVANGLYMGENAYLKSGWNKIDIFLVVISSVDVIISLTAKSSHKIFGILRVFRLLRTLRPLRVISRAPGLKLVVTTLLSSIRPIGNIVLICCTFFIIFGILGVQLFKGKFYHCVGDDIKNVRTREDCLANPHNQWINSQYNFDNLGQALMALFVLASKDGWVNIMYTGIDAVGVDKQPIENYNEWMLVYFISFLLLVGFFVLNMFVGVVIENFHKCRAAQEREEKARNAAKRARKIEKARNKMKEIPYYANYSKTRMLLHDVCNSKYFDLIIAGVIGVNVITMSVEFYKMPDSIGDLLDTFNYVFTCIFLLEAIMRLTALGFVRYFKEKWNQLDVLIVALSIVGIFFDKLSTKASIPINPTIIRVMRVLRIARVLKLLKMASGIRSLLDTVIQALPQVGNLALLFFLLFFIFAALGVELFGRLNCESNKSLCDGLSKHAHFHNFGMAFLTLFRIATGDNWNGIMKDTLRNNILCLDNAAEIDINKPLIDTHNTSLTCLASVLAPIYFVIFVLMSQFVLINVVVAVLMKHLDDSNKMAAELEEMDKEIYRRLAENDAIEEARLRGDNVINLNRIKDSSMDLGHKTIRHTSSLPSNFILNNTNNELTNSKHSIFAKTRSKLNMSFKKKTRTFDSIKETNEPSCTSNNNDTNKSDLFPNGGLTSLNQDQLNKTLNHMNLSDKRNHYKSLNSQSSIKTHFSPQTSVRIKVIDEIDGDS